MHFCLAQVLRLEKSLDWIVCPLHWPDFPSFVLLLKQIYCTRQHSAVHCNRHTESAKVWLQLDNFFTLLQDCRHSRSMHIECFAHIVLLWNHSFGLVWFPNRKSSYRAGNRWGNTPWLLTLALHKSRCWYVEEQLIVQLLSTVYIHFLQRVTYCMLFLANSLKTSVFKLPKGHKGYIYESAFLEAMVRCESLTCFQGWKVQPVPFHIEGSALQALKITLPKPCRSKYNMKVLGACTKEERREKERRGEE